MMIRKSLKSIQMCLNEAYLAIGLPLVSSSAYSQARRHLNYTAFIELNQAAIVEVVYEGEEYLRWQEFRLLGIDGSMVRLPSNQEMTQAFGEIPYTDGQGSQIAGSHVMGRMSVLYDVLNHIGLEGVLDPYDTSEGDQAVSHLAATQAGDLLIMDRGYPSYFLLASIIKAGREAVIRCSSGSFAVANEMFTGKGQDSRVVTLKVPSNQRLRVKAAGLPATIRVRFVRVELDTGDYEVLVTTLLDEIQFPTAVFKALYQLRWGIETFYDILKNRLNLENFTGKTPLSVQQDFHATLYLTGLESILTQKAQQTLSQKNRTQYRQQVNHAVAFNALKNKAFDLLFSDSDADLLLEQLTQLFLMSPTLVRPNRPRESSDRKSKLSHALDYYKRRRKIVF